MMRIDGWGCEDSDGQGEQDSLMGATLFVKVAGSGIRGLPRIQPVVWTHPIDDIVCVCDVVQSFSVREGIPTLNNIFLK